MVKDIKVEDLQWEPHPEFKNLLAKKLRIPAGIKHQPHDIEEDVIGFDIFSAHQFQEDMSIGIVLS